MSEGTAIKRVLLAVLWVWLVLPLEAGAAGLTVSNPQTDANGVVWYDAASSYNGPGSTTLRVLAPTNPAGTTRRFIYVLPVIDDVGLQDFFGDGLSAATPVSASTRARRSPWTTGAAAS